MNSMQLSQLELERQLEVALAELANATSGVSKRKWAVVVADLRRECQRRLLAARSAR
jgi:hypothetical protein